MLIETVERAEVHRGQPDRLGRAGDAHRLHQHRAAVLLDSVFSRRGRSRILPGRHRLPHSLVPLRRSQQSRRAVHDRHSRCRTCSGSVIAAFLMRIIWLGLAGLALAADSRRDSGRRRRPGDVRLPDRLAEGRPVAAEGRTRLDRGELEREQAAKKTRSPGESMARRCATRRSSCSPSCTSATSPTASASRSGCRRSSSGSPDCRRFR